MMHSENKIILEREVHLYPFASSLRLAFYGISTCLALVLKLDIDGKSYIFAGHFDTPAGIQSAIKKCLDPLREAAGEIACEVILAYGCMDSAAVLDEYHYATEAQKYQIGMAVNPSYASSPRSIVNFLENASSLSIYREVQLALKEWPIRWPRQPRGLKVALAELFPPEHGYGEEVDHIKLNLQPDHLPNIDIQTVRLAKSSSPSLSVRRSMEHTWILLSTSLLSQFALQTKIAWPYRIYTLDERVCSRTGMYTVGAFATVAALAVGSPGVALTTAAVGLGTALCLR